MTAPDDSTGLSAPGDSDRYRAIVERSGRVTIYDQRGDDAWIRSNLTVELPDADE